MSNKTVKERVTMLSSKFECFRGQLMTEYNVHLANTLGGERKKLRMSTHRYAEVACSFVV